MDQRTGRAAGVWVAGEIIGAILLTLGLILHSAPLWRAAFVFIAIGLAGGALTRLFAFGVRNVLGGFAILSIGGRLVASLILLYFAATFHF